MTARPAAGDSRTDRERVREAIEDWLWQRESLNSGFHDGQRQAWAAGARLDLDDLMVLPEIAALLDAAEKDRQP